MKIMRVPEAQNARTSVRKDQQQPLTLQMCYMRLPARIKPVKSHIFNIFF